ncbi:MAG: phenylalanine 4-monooxygenase [Pseudomonadota bacterium]
MKNDYAENPFAAPTRQKLRGDYDNMQADYTVEQNYDYTDEEQARWRSLYDRQMKILPNYAAEEFIEGLQALGVQDAVPRLEKMSDILKQKTGWTLVAVPGLIPNDVFFRHLANRRFPICRWLRRADEMDYLVEPDIFHDFFGHVPLLSNPVFADYMAEYGRQGEIAIGLGADHILARLYWYMAEFGLISTPNGLRAFGAGMLSSSGETVYSVESPQPNRVRFDVERVMGTSYMVDDYQKTYFVIESYGELFNAAQQDFGPIYRRILDHERNSAPYDPEFVLPHDDILTVGQWNGMDVLS